jgi:hypothetical protein
MKTSSLIERPPQGVCAKAWLKHNLGSTSLSRLSQLLVGLCALGAAPSEAVGQIVWLDARNGYSAEDNLYNGQNFSGMREAFVENALQLQPAFSFAAIPSEVTAVVLMQPYERSFALTLEEINALAEFAAAGGGVLVMAEAGEGSRAAYLGNFASRLGIGISQSPTEADGHIVEAPFVDHQITLGISRVGVDYQRRLSVGGAAVDLTTGSGADDFLAVSGRAVFISDAGMFATSPTEQGYGLTFGDNRQLLSNIVSFIAVPEPTSHGTVLLALLVCAAVRWRVKKPWPRSGYTNRESRNRKA